MVSILPRVGLLKITEVIFVLFAYTQLHFFGLTPYHLLFTTCARDEVIVVITFPVAITFSVVIR